MAGANRGSKIAPALLGRRFWKLPTHRILLLLLAALPTPLPTPDSCSGRRSQPQELASRAQTGVLLMQPAVAKQQVGCMQTILLSY